MSRAFLRTAAVVGSAALLLSAPATALAAGKPLAHKPHATKAKHVAKKSVKPVPFAAVGTIVGLDAEARTVSVKVTGGSSNVRGKTVVLTLVTSTKTTVDGAPASLDLVDVGDKATANGRQAGGVLQAAHLNVTSAPVVPAPEQPAA